MADLQEAGLKLVAEGTGAFESAIGGVNGVIEAFGGVVGQVASAATTALVDFFSDSFAGALEAEQTMARLGQVIESTGGIAGITVKDAEALADEFKNLAGGSDDAIISIIDMGLRMGTVSEDMMPSFIQNTLDLGAVMNDAGKASQLMARAIEDPVGVLGTLRKAGILVNEETEAQIKAMVKAGDTAGAYALLMGTVEAATEGAAEALAMTTAGQWAIFQETIADAGETIVGAFLPALNGILAGFMPLVPIISEVATVIGNLITDFIDTGGDFGVVADGIREGFAGILPQEVIDSLANGALWFRDTLPGIMESGRAAIQPVIDAATNVANAFIASMPMIQTTVQVMADYVVAKFNEFAPVIIANVTSTLNSIAEFWTNHGDEVMATVALIWEFIVTTVGVAITATSGIIAAGMELINGDTKSAGEILKSTFSTIMESILSIVDTDLESFVASWTGTFAMVDDIIKIGVAAWQNMWLGGLASAIAAAQLLVADFLQLGADIVQGVVDGINANIANVGNSLLGGLQNAIAAAQGLLLAKSPSRLTMNEIGKPFSEGIAAGIMAGLKDIDAAVGIAIKPLVAPPLPASLVGMGRTNYTTNSESNYNLNVHTTKPMTTIAGEFTVMQTLTGGGI